MGSEAKVVPSERTEIQTKHQLIPMKPNTRTWLAGLAVLVTTAASVSAQPALDDGEIDFVDDDNGYVDDVYGYDFVNNDNTVYDGGREKDDHGTHVAGMIGAVGGNGLGVVGVCWNVKLLSRKFLGAKGGTLADEVKAIEYFIDLRQRRGLNIVAINASYGGGRNLTEQVAVIRASKAGILVVAAAGNQGGAYSHYRASYDTSLDALNGDGTVAEPGAGYDAVISVAAIDSKGALPSWSNYGSIRVDLGAPGNRILSTLPGGR
jgi:hypothetical protein